MAIQRHASAAPVIDRLASAAKTVLQYGWVPFIIYIGISARINFIERDYFVTFLYLGYKYSIPQPPLHRILNPFA